MVLFGNIRICNPAMNRSLLTNAFFCYNPNSIVIYPSIIPFLLVAVVVLRRPLPVLNNLKGLVQFIGAIVEKDVNIFRKWCFTEYGYMVSRGAIFPVQ